MGSIAGVDIDILYNRAKGFIKESAPLRADGDKMLLVMDGCSYHIAYKKNNILKDNGIVFPVCRHIHHMCCNL